MSNEPAKIRLDRPLNSVHTGGKAKEGTAEPAQETVVRVRLAKAREQLDGRERRLEQKEAELQERERELERKQRETQEKMSRLTRLIGSVTEEKAEMLQSSEEEIVSFSLSITEKVLQHEIENGRYKMKEVVRSALQAVREKGSVVVRVNPDDYEMTRASLEELGQTFGATRVQTVPDESISPASCCIETDSGKIFSEIPGRLERIEKSLLKKNGDSHGV